MNSKKDKWLYVLWLILMLTWALIANVIYTIIGFFIYLIYCRKLTKTEWKYGRFVIYLNYKVNFGGIDFGWFVFVNESSKSTLKHELGHTLQIAFYGIFSLFIVSLASVIRFWYREYLFKHNFDKFLKLPSYDSVWFEKQATQWGNKYFKNAL